MFMLSLLVDDADADDVDAVDADAATAARF